MIFELFPNNKSHKNKFNINVESAQNDVHYKKNYNNKLTTKLN